MVQPDEVGPREEHGPRSPLRPPPGYLPAVRPTVFDPLHLTYTSVVTHLKYCGGSTLVFKTRRYAARSIKALHAWQIEALRAGNGACWQAGDSLVYSAPTGGGKTLVAEILMLRRILVHGIVGTVLWIVPLKALANEVASKLGALLEGICQVTECGLCLVSASPKYYLSTPNSQN